MFFNHHLLLGDMPGMVVADKSSTLAQQRASFLAAAQDGHKPMWLAVGGAWTGVDVSGKDLGIVEQKDSVLTDLVIPRLPFRNNRSMTHRTRMERRPERPWELFDTAMRLKQGLGRLVRRENVPKNRRIFVLDSRLSDPAFDGFLGIIKRILGVYKQVEWTMDDAVEQRQKRA